MISKKEYEKLKRDQEKLEALEAGGVDNWEFYGEALKEWEAKYELKEKRENLLEDLSECFGECAFEPSEAGAGIAFRDEAVENAMAILEEYGVIFKD